MRYEVDPTSITAVIALLDKGEYELSVGEPKAFEKKTKKDTDSNGVRYPVTVAEGPEKGARTYYTCWLHSEGGMGFAKGFIMACLGYAATRDAEKTFDAKYRGSDWGYNPEDGSTGDVWREATGKRVMATVDLRLGEDGQTMQQQWKSFRPV